MPLLTADEQNEDAGLPEVGWWEQHKTPPKTFSPVLITTHVAAPLSELFTDPANADRQKLIERFLAQKLGNKLNAIFGRFQQEAGILEQREARLNGAGLYPPGIVIQRQATRTDNRCFSARSRTASRFSGGLRAFFDQIRHGTVFQRHIGVQPLQLGVLRFRLLEAL